MAAKLITASALSDNLCLNFTALTADPVIFATKIIASSQRSLVWKDYKGRVETLFRPFDRD